MNINSTTETNGIAISVYPKYLKDRKMTQGAKYFFIYTVIIENRSKEKVKLLSRHWLIINSEGESEEVTGEGVVGYFPELDPGEEFSYNSYCPINTEWATMEGEYQFIREDNTMFVAKIDRFYFVVPNSELVNV